MKRWIGLAAITLSALGIVAYKEAARLRAGAPATPRAPEVRTSDLSEATVLLFADPREAGTRCVCGEIFAAVRAAASQGGRVREIDPGRETALATTHRVTVEPTLIVLDTTGHEVARHEGESEEVLAAVRRDLARLTRR